MCHRPCLDKLVYEEKEVKERSVLRHHPDAKAGAASEGPRWTPDWWSAWAMSTRLASPDAMTNEVQYVANRMSQMPATQHRRPRGGKLSEECNGRQSW